MSSPTRLHGCLCRRSSWPQPKHNNMTTVQMVRAPGEIWTVPLTGREIAFVITVYWNPCYHAGQSLWGWLYCIVTFFPNNYKVHISAHWGGLLKVELSDLEVCHLQHVKHPHEVNFTCSEMLHYSHQTGARTMVKRVSHASGTESAAGGERSHLLYGNPSALNHSRDLQWSRISHRD